MPFIDGQKVTNEEFLRDKNSRTLNWREATGWASGDDAPSPSEASQAELEPIIDEVLAVDVEAAPPVKRRTRAKNKQAEAAILKATGLSVDLDVHGGDALPELTVTVAEAEDDDAQPA